MNKLSRPKDVVRNLFIVVVAAALVYSCGSKSSTGNGEAAAPVAGDLVTWTIAGSIDTFSLNIALAELGITNATVTSGVSCYHLTYRTPDPRDVLINASGLVCIPSQKSGSSPVISYQHATIFQKSEAPSNLFASPEGLVGALLAGLGYIVVMPDYLGYGDSASIPHPFLHASTLASASADMNRAARMFLALSSVHASMNGQLFLAGYSEGGYATMAAQRLMEQSLPAEFPVTASEPGAGPYDLSGTTKTILGLPIQAQPAYSGFFFKAYDSLYNAASQLDVYFPAPYADVVRTHFDGTFSLSQISDALGGSGVGTNTLFNPAFIADYLGIGQVQLKAVITENDIYNWAPKVATRLFQGVGDDIVPYANTTTAKAAMDKNGSTTVTVVNCIAGTLPTTHDNCVKPYAIDMINFFKTLATGL